MQKLSLKVYQGRKKNFCYGSLNNAVRSSLLMLTDGLENQASLLMSEVKYLLTMNMKFLRYLPEEHRSHVFLQ